MIIKILRLLHSIDISKEIAKIKKFFNKNLVYIIFLLTFVLQIFEAIHNKDYSVVKTFEAARKCRFFYEQFF
ncbi:hypothetical protein FACS189452_05070 [Bacteroidia bacterium]|nr:hypothetical protein FACS189452_05070 [Bacteroidia bacterium]GHT80895.1 hypothetical protein FACS189467_4010 [Bacteroidia bacterium]